MMAHAGPPAFAAASIHACTSATFFLWTMRSASCLGACFTTHVSALRCDLCQLLQIQKWLTWNVLNRIKATNSLHPNLQTCLPWSATALANPGIVLGTVRKVGVPVTIGSGEAVTFCVNWRRVSCWDFFGAGDLAVPCMQIWIVLSRFPWGWWASLQDLTRRSRPGRWEGRARSSSELKSSRTTGSFLFRELAFDIRKLCKAAPRLSGQLVPSLRRLVTTFTF